MTNGNRYRRQIRTVAAALVIAFAATLAACDTGTEPPVRIEFDALVMMAVLEGPNTFVLQRLDSNEAYFPINLPAEYHVEGARVHVEALLIREYQVLLHPAVEILSITAIAD